MYILAAITKKKEERPQKAAPERKPKNIEKKKKSVTMTSYILNPCYPH